MKYVRSRNERMKKVGINSHTYGSIHPLIHKKEAHKAPLYRAKCTETIKSAIIGMTSLHNASTKEMNNYMNSVWITVGDRVEDPTDAIGQGIGQ